MKTQQFCETSSIFELGNILNEAILPDFPLSLTTSKTKQFCETSFKNGKLSAELTASYQCVLRFPAHATKVLRLPRKIDARSYEVLHLPCKIIFPKLKIWCSKMQPFSGNQRPDLWTSLMNMSLVLRLPRDMHLCRSSSNVLRLPSWTTSRAIYSTARILYVPFPFHWEWNAQFEKTEMHSLPGGKPRVFCKSTKYRGCLSGP